MTDTVTLLALRTKVRQRADMVGSLFVTDAELTIYVQDSYKELYDLITDCVEDYNLTSLSSAATLITTGNTFNLPATFYKLRGLDDLTDTNTPRTVRKFLFGERNDYEASNNVAVGNDYSDVLYRIVGSTIEIVPSDRAPRQYRLWYVPLPTLPTADGDTIEVINGFDEYVVIDAAIKCLIKEESNIAPLQAQKSSMTDRIYRMRANRDQNLPERVTRVKNRTRSVGSQRDF